MRIFEIIKKVRAVGVEPTRISPADFKSTKAANYITLVFCGRNTSNCLPCLSTRYHSRPFFKLTPSRMSQTIYCFNNSTVLKTTDMILMINALNTMLPAFCSTWTLGNKRYVCQAAPANMRFGTGMYCVFMDTSDSAGALAYHTETNNVPFSKVFVKTILQYGGAILMGATARVPTVAQAFAHEIFEMIMNQNVNVWWQLSNGNMVPAEVSDPVQGNVVPVRVGSVTVGLSDYVLPAWSDPQATRGPYNFLNTLTRPFQLARGGYVILMRNGTMSYVLGTSVSPYIEYRAGMSVKHE